MNRKGTSRIRKFLCNVLGWHKPDNYILFDGFLLHSVCRYCKKKIMEDSQGNWFEESEDTE